jgi:hypothetical protein
MQKATTYRSHRISASAQSSAKAKAKRATLRGPFKAPCNSLALACALQCPACRARQSISRNVGAKDISDCAASLLTKTHHANVSTRPSHSARNIGYR